MELNRIINDDCFNVMKKIPDKYFDLCLTDPPYGIDYGGQLKGHGDGNGGRNKYGWKDWNAPEWDKERPEKEVFEQIMRVSKNQIIWGGNYFADYMPPSQGWLVWNKGQRNFSIADGELAWTSFDKALRIFDYSRGEALKDGKIHPTQKPVALFSWVLEMFSKEGDKVFDPFSGSGTTAIACHRGKRQFLCVEKDEVYFQKSVERLEEERKQMILL